MKGAMLFFLVLFIVFAIPLYANHALVNTVGKALSNSTINSEEVPFNQQELFDSNITILAVGLNKEHPINYIVMINGVSISYNNNNVSQNYTNKNTNDTGGVHRIKSGRH